MTDGKDRIVMIIDDTPANVAVLTEFLERQNFQVLVAQEGEEGIERAELAQPDIILLDAMMPGIDGFETCKRLKALKTTCDIPVIFMTALTSSEDKVAAFDAGGVDYIPKPFQIEEVLARVNTHLNLRHMHRQLAMQNQELIHRNVQLNELNEKLSTAQTQLIQSEKLASIGQLAAGVAHEINNPIGFISSNLSTLNSYLESLFETLSAYENIEKTIDSPEVIEKLKALRKRIDLDFIKDDIPALISETHDGAIRVKKIVQYLRDFSHVDNNQDWQWSDIHQGIDSTLNIVANEVKYKADIIKLYGKIPEVKCLPLQLNQVFMNLIINAAQDIEDERGTITIKTAQENNDVWIEISDTGSGITKENLPYIFKLNYLRHSRRLISVSSSKEQNI